MIKLSTGPSPLSSSECLKIKSSYCVCMDGGRKTGEVYRFDYDNDDDGTRGRRMITLKL